MQMTLADFDQSHFINYLYLNNFLPTRKPGGEGDARSEPGMTGYSASSGRVGAAEGLM